MSRQISRRRFIGEASCAAVGSTAAFSSLLNLQLSARAVAAQVAPPDDYKALVCVFLAGGNDSYNMLVPTDDENYAAYARARGNIALQRTSGDPLVGPILDLATNERDGRTYGIHPAMSEVRDLFNTGDLGFVANVGTLVEPIADRDSYLSGKFRLPHALYSHNDQIAQWQTGYSEGALRSGWAGRAQDLLAAVNPNSGIAMNISVGGTNMWQTGINSTFFSINSDGSVPLHGKQAAAGTLDRLRYEAVGYDRLDPATMSGQQYSNLFQQAYLHELQRSTAADLEFAVGFDAVSLNTEFNPASKLERDLRAVARTIGARTTFDMRRQVFFVVVGGWDHHHELLDTHATMLGGVSAGLASFQQTLNELGVADDVVTFTASDFGRTMRTNGRGTDHGWGGHQIVMGGPVKGGRIHGKYPDAAQMGLYGPLDTGNGRLIPTTSVDSYAGELATWFGVPPDLLDVVLPNVREFFTPDKFARPVGFLEDGSEPFDATVTASCVDFDGRLDFRLINSSDAVASYTIEVSDREPETFLLGPGDTGEVVIDGRHDGDVAIRVLKDDFILLDTVETFACDPIGPEVEIVTRCLNNVSNIDVSLVNPGPIDVVYEVVVDGQLAQPVAVGPRRKALLTFMDWPDNTYSIGVLRDGVLIFTSEEFLSCKLAVDEVTVAVVCAANSGRVNVDLKNSSDIPAVYDVRIGSIARTAMLQPGEAQQLFATGRTDGELDVVVIRDGFEVHRSTETVACNIPEAPVIVESSCLGGSGRVDIALLNDGGGDGEQAEYRVLVGHIERTRYLDLGASTRFAVTGRRNGEWPVTVERNGVEIYSSVEIINC